MISETKEHTSATQHDHVRGNADAPVTLVEYGEFECPDCGRSYHLVKRLLAEASDEFRFVFRHFARDDIHPFSERSAEAAEAAGAQGRFWEMHDFLFEHQHELEYEDLTSHAEGLGLDVARFRHETGTHVHLPAVRHDLESGRSHDVTGTPTFFIDGAKYEGPHEAAALLAAIRAAAPD